jgi:hypothetical protein
LDGLVIALERCFAFLRRCRRKGLALLSGRRDERASLGIRRKRTVALHIGETRIERHDLIIQRAGHLAPEGGRLDCRLALRSLTVCLPLSVSSSEIFFETCPHVVVLFVIHDVSHLRLAHPIVRRPHRRLAKVNLRRRGRPPIPVTPQPQDGTARKGPPKHAVHRPVRCIVRPAKELTMTIDDMKRKAQEAADEIKRKAGEAKEKIQAGAEELREGAQEKGEEAEERLDEVKREASAKREEFEREHGKKAD